MGFCLPYADPRAYRDRLNLLFTTKGWTNDFSVVTTTAKVIVTCRLTLDVLGTKAATGEEWLKNENAATSAEAQSFKRACACFGLGRYLYSFVGSWLTLDEEMRPASPPVLPKWATPDGWRDGYRPEPAGPKPVTNAATVTEVAEANSRGEKSPVRSGRNFKNVIQDIRNLKPTLGDRLYRHLLKHVAHVFRPEDIREIALQHKVLALMNSARRGLERLRAARAKVSESVAQDILRSAELQSFDEIPDMTTLQQVVLGLERASDGLGSAANPQG